MLHKRFPQLFKIKIVQLNIKRNKQNLLKKSQKKRQLITTLGHFQIKINAYKNGLSLEKNFPNFILLSSRRSFKMIDSLPEISE